MQDVNSIVLRPKLFGSSVVRLDHTPQLLLLIILLVSVKVKKSIFPTVEMKIRSGVCDFRG